MSLCGSHWGFCTSERRMMYFTNKPFSRELYGQICCFQERRGGNVFRVTFAVGNTCLCWGVDLPEGGRVGSFTA